MGRIVSSLALAALGIVMSGCSIIAPPYPPSIDNIETLKHSGVPAARVGTFTTAQGPATPNPISLRGNKMRSPYDGSFSTYLSAAVTRELTLAGKLSPESDVEISGTLLRNEVDPAITTASSKVEARFVVRKGSVVRYDQVKSAQRQWDSSFAGAVAIPLAVREYGFTVQALLGTLYADPAFLDALR